MLTYSFRRGKFWRFCSVLVQTSKFQIWYGVVRKHFESWFCFDYKATECDDFFFSKSFRCWVTSRREKSTTNTAKMALRAECPAAPGRCPAEERTPSTPETHARLSRSSSAPRTRSSNSSASVAPWAAGPGVLPRPCSTTSAGTRTATTWRRTTTSFPCWAVAVVAASPRWRDGPLRRRQRTRNTTWRFLSSPSRRVARRRWRSHALVLLRTVAQWRWGVNWTFGMIFFVCAIHF